MNLAPHAKETLLGSPKVDLAINLVKGLIQTGEFRPGDRLPNEAELSGKLGVSRNSLREAVRAMQAMRILESRQGDGTYVSNLDPAGMMEILSFAVDVSDAQSVYWFLELRRTLEVQAVESTTARRTARELHRLESIHAETLAEEDADRRMHLDTLFHNTIAEIAGNPVHTALLKVVSAPTLRARIWRQRTEDGEFDHLSCEHEDILCGIRTQDIQKARFAMWRHVGNVIDWVNNNRETLNTPEGRDE